MEHYPFMSLADDTEITYSDLKTKESGDEYVTIYFETPYPGGFKSMDIEYPGGVPEHIEGYTQSELDRMLFYYDKMAPVAFGEAKDGTDRDRLYDELDLEIFDEER